MIPIFISFFFIIFRRYKPKSWANSKIFRYKLHNMGTTQQKRFTFSTYNSLLSKKDEIRFIANKTKAIRQ